LRGGTHRAFLGEIKTRRHRALIAWRLACCAWAHCVSHGASTSGVCGHRIGAALTWSHLITSNFTSFPEQKQRVPRVAYAAGVMLTLRLAQLCLTRRWRAYRAAASFLGTRYSALCCIYHL